MTALNPDLSKPTCRVCLQNYQNQELSSIFDRNTDFHDLHIYEIIEKCAGIKLLSHEKVPTLICGDCYGFLKVSYKFRTICRNSNEYLMEFVVSEAVSTKTETSPKQNPLTIIKKSSKRLQNKAKLREKESSQTQTIKNEFVSPINSPTICEDSNNENIGDGDDDDTEEEWLNIDYHDEDVISIDENFETSTEKVELNLRDEKVKDLIRKPTKRKKKTALKIKKSGTAPKTLGISSDGAAIIHETKHRTKGGKKKKQPHICEICGNIYQGRYTLELHMKRHGDKKPYECEICSSAFHNNFELIRHMRKHTGSRPYKCSYCPRDFGDQSTLIKHERIHRNERPFKCDTCGKSFTYSNVLKYHILVHTGEKPYGCEICGKCFNSPHHLRSHLRTLQHKNDPRTNLLIQNIKKNNEDGTLKVSNILQSV